MDLLGFLGQPKQKSGRMLAALSRTTGLELVALNLKPLFELGREKTGLCQRNHALDIEQVPGAHKVGHPLHENGFLREDERIPGGGRRGRSGGGGIGSR
jgi:hypothetical protein